MKDYKDFPPVNYFMRVLKSCPKSALLYAQIWDKKKASGRLITQKTDVRKQYNISPTIFRNLAAPLMNMNVLHFSESEERFYVDILGPHVNE